MVRINKSICAKVATHWDVRFAELYEKWLQAKQQNQEQQEEAYYQQLINAADLCVQNKKLANSQTVFLWVAIMASHLIELSHRYLLGVGDNHTYTIKRLGSQQTGKSEDTKAKVCTSFEQLIETLICLELKQEDVVCLQDCQKILKAIHAEIKNAIVQEQSHSI